MLQLLFYLPIIALSMTSSSDVVSGCAQGLQLVGQSLAQGQTNTPTVLLVACQHKSCCHVLWATQRVVPPADTPHLQIQQVSLTRAGLSSYSWFLYRHHLRLHVYTNSIRLFLCKDMKHQELGIVDIHIEDQTAG